MTEFNFFPIKKITIHEMSKYEEKDFIEFFVHPGGRLSWCDGVLYDFQTFTPTPEIISQQLQGHYHWGSFQFCKMDEFRSKVINTEVNYEMLVGNTSAIPVFKELIEWLKKQEIWKDEDGK